MNSSSEVPQERNFFLFPPLLNYIRRFLRDDHPFKLELQQVNLVTCQNLKWPSEIMLEILHIFLLVSIVRVLKLNVSFSKLQMVFILVFENWNRTLH